MRTALMMNDYFIELYFGLIWLLLRIDDVKNVHNQICIIRNRLDSKPS